MKFRQKLRITIHDTQRMIDNNRSDKEIHAFLHKRLNKKVFSLPKNKEKEEVICESCNKGKIREKN